jgi:hypothetical protein
MKTTTIYVGQLGIAMLLLAGCGDSGGVKESVGGLINQITSDVMNEIRKEYPVPDSVSSINAHNNVLTYTTTLTVDKVVDFYRQEYPRRGAPEVREAAAVSEDSARLTFRNSSTNKDIYLEATKSNDETRVRVEKK